MIKIEVSYSGLKIQDFKIEPLMRSLVRDVTEYAYLLARFEEAPERTGRLKRSIKRKVRGTKGEVRAEAPYAVFVEKGTRPHIIRPVRARALRFQVGGEIVFAKLVHHPGTKPNPFMRRAAERTAQKIPDLFGKVWRKHVALYS